MKNNKNYILRDYQKQGKNKVLESIRAKFRQKVDLEKINSNFKSADLIEMATGSGKTLLSGEIISHVLKVKNKLGEKLNFGGLNVLVLSNRIDGVNQFHEDWFVGRNGKKPIFSEEILARSEVKIFHYRSSDKIENFEENGKHKIFFSTYQTAKLENFAEKLKNIDIIIIDEAHNVGFENNDFFEVLKNLEKNGRNGHKTEIIALTATPDNVTKENFGESIFTFGLPEYLASEYSPNVNYQVVTGTSADNEEIKNLEEKIKSFKNISNFDLKKEKIEELEADLDKIFQKSPSSESLCKDILEKISENNEIKKSVIFVNSIEEAEEIAVILNSLSDSNSAVAYHSKSKEKNILENFSKSDSEKKILICVDKANESIDLPVVENIIFYRNTNSGKIFLQQFGRGLRGDGTVNYFDYVGSLKNFSWIGNIYREYKEFVKNKKKSKNYESEIIDEIEENDKKFNFYGGNLKTKNFKVDLYDLIEKISNLKENAELTKEDVRDFFKKESIEYWLKLNQEGKKNIKIKNKGLNAISTLFGIKKGNPLKNPDIYIKLLEEIFETEIDIETLIKKGVRDFFKKESIEYWLKLSPEEKKNIKIKGKGLIAISRIFGIKKGDPLSNSNIYTKLLEEIFETEIDIETLTKDDVRDFFKKESIEYWLKLTQEEKKNIKIENKGLVAISTLFGIKGDPIIFKEIYTKLLEEIFEIKIDIETLIKKGVRDFFKKESIEYWLKLIKEEKKNIKIENKGLIAISRIFGIKKGDPLNNTDIYIKLLEEIFETEIDIETLTKEDVRDFFKEKDLKYWESLGSIEKNNIKIKNKGLIAISRIFGIKKGNPLKELDIYIKLLEEIFETEIEKN